MPDRAKEKLVELMDDYTDHLSVRDIHKADFAEKFADHLIANGVTVQEWIPVKDRLPEKSGLVIGYDIVWGVGCFYYHTDMQSSTWQQITHWMPLPHPPKGE